jgi:acetyl-CoA carboxylase biotin carboxyl carrier protein
MSDPLDFISGSLPSLLRLLRGTDVRELAIEEGDVRLKIRRSPELNPEEVVVVGAELAEPLIEEPAAVEVTAPLVGTFYRAEQPGAPPLVEEGSLVEPDTVVGIIEALHVLTEVEAGCSGTVTHVLATDGLAVQYGQPLFHVMPGG